MIFGELLGGRPSFIPCLSPGFDYGHSTIWIQHGTCLVHHHQQVPKWHVLFNVERSLFTLLWEIKVTSQVVDRQSQLQQ